MNARIDRFIFGTALAATLGFCGWLYFEHLSAGAHQVALHREVGRTLAEQAVNVLGAKGRIVSISIDPTDSVEAQVQLESFRATLNKLGQYQLQEVQMDSTDQPFHGVGSGLSAEQYIRIVNKNADADLFASFSGAPKLSPEQIVDLGNKPKLVAVSISEENLETLFEKGILLSAVVAQRSPSTGQHKPYTAEEWFQQKYQILTANKVNSSPIPK